MHTQLHEKTKLTLLPWQVLVYHLLKLEQHRADYLGAIAKKTRANRDL